MVGKKASQQTTITMYQNGTVAVRVGEPPQVDFLVRVVYFLFVGWWLGYLWTLVGYFLCFTMVLMPESSSSMKEARHMTTLANKRIAEHPSPTPTTRRQAAPWGYFLYCEVLKIFRDPAAVITTVAFPAVIFMIVGLRLPGLASTILASEAAYGAFLVSITSFSISLATERSLGWNKLLRTTSMSSALYLGCKLLVILLTGTISMLLLFAVAGSIGGVHLDLAMWAELLGVMVLGIIPLGLLGLFLGFLGSVSLTVALSMSLLIVMSFASGIFVPLQFLPAFLQQIAPYLPTYQLVQLGWSIVGSPSGNGQVWTHGLILLAYAVSFAVLAGWAYIRDENKNFA